MLCSIDEFRPEYNSKREESGLRVLLFFMPSERKKWKRNQTYRKGFRVEEIAGQRGVSMKKQKPMKVV